MECIEFLKRDVKDILLMFLLIKFSFIINIIIIIIIIIIINAVKLSVCTVL